MGLAFEKNAYLIQGDKEIEIDKEEFIIGRAVHVDSNMYNNMVSRLHCRIVKHQNKYFVEDLQAMNGTYIDGERLQPHTPTEIKDGQMLTILNAV